MPDLIRHPGLSGFKIANILFYLQLTSPLSSASDYVYFLYVMLTLFFSLDRLQGEVIIALKLSLRGAYKGEGTGSGIRRIRFSILGLIICEILNYVGIVAIKNPGHPLWPGFLNKLIDDC